ncbi:MAG: glucose-1-phosphate cytidylyltransferase [Ignavibacteria bacterium]|nr:glucose-1-phosphate cytidylyltransferase [Ignavibacteria bacterium]
MKVVIFCGGLGTRLREYSETIPKPLVNIGDRPIIWHLMKYYAHYGHRDFILCLGYRGDLIKNFFLNYDECVSNDFVLSEGGRKIELFNNDIADWRITFVDTGSKSNIGQRLKAVEELLAGEEVFLANYADGLSDYPLDSQIDHFIATDAVASFVAVRPSQSFHAVTVDNDSRVTEIESVKSSQVWINGGFFILRREIFSYMQSCDELVEAPFQRLIGEGKLLASKYEGFWSSMDTFKDKKQFDELYDSGRRPWQIWHKSC